jgi:hypothetical protein
MSFNSFDIFDYIIENQLADEYYINPRETVEHLLEIVGMDEMEAIEAWAAEHGQISSERELSERFDQMIRDDIDSGFLVDLEDKPGMRETFNNWTDALCRDGELHDRQYHEYTYVGEFDLDD